MQRRLRRPRDGRPRLRRLQCDLRRVPVVHQRPLHVSERHDGMRRRMRGRHDGRVELRSLRGDLQGLDSVLQPGRLRGRVHSGSDGVRSRLRRHALERTELRRLRSPLPRRRGVLGGNMHVSGGTVAVQRGVRDLGHEVRRHVRRADGALRGPLREHEHRRAQLRSLRSPLPHGSHLRRRRMRLPGDPHVLRRRVRRHPDERGSLRRLQHAVHDGPAVPRRALRAVSQTAHT